MLATELARTGVHKQTYTLSPTAGGCARAMPALSHWSLPGPFDPTSPPSKQRSRISRLLGRPAFLVYYGPSFLRQSVSDPYTTLRVLAEVYRAARRMFPLEETAEAESSSVLVHIDQLKAAGPARDICASVGLGNIWLLSQTASHVGVLQPHALYEQTVLHPPDTVMDYTLLRFGTHLFSDVKTPQRSKSADHIQRKLRSLEA